jgi:hypothetical protein
MTRQQRRHTPQDPAPLIYTSLSTHRSSYPTWVLIKSSPTPHIVRRSDLGNEATELLFSMNRAVQVPPLVNDVAESLDWLVHSVPLPLAYCRRTIIVCLEEVCDFNSRSHIHLLNAHFSIMMVAMSTVLDNFFPASVTDEAKEVTRDYMLMRWGNNRMHLVGFRNILLECYHFINVHYGFGFLYFTNNREYYF